MRQMQRPPALDVSKTPVSRGKGPRETEEHTMVNPLARGRDQPLSPATAGQPMPIDQIFAEVDTDNSGTIEFGEFAEYWGARQMATKGSTDEDVLGTMWDLFEKYDSDGNEGLSLFEFRGLLSEMAMGDWKEERDPRTGRIYFVNPVTRGSQWVRFHIPMKILR